MKLPILKNPNEILRKKSAPLKEITPEIQRLILDMAQTMKTADGIGLAAPQIGRNIRLIVINTKNGPVALINPKFTYKSFRKLIDEEGCLSVPGTWGKVKRCKSVRVKALNKNGKELKFKAEGMFARVLQHEVDHLDGILFIDKLVK